MDYSMQVACSKVGTLMLFPTSIGKYRRCKMAAIVYIAIALVGLIFGALSLVGVQPKH